MFRSRHCAVAFAFAATVAMFGPSSRWLQAGESASADTPYLAPLVPGLGADDPRGRLDPDKLPWRAVGKLQVASLNIRQFCTATLVGPSMVLTAAHCAFNPPHAAVLVPRLVAFPDRL
jgi:V8-like Glu-specific endopeptidase